MSGLCYSCDGSGSDRVDRYGKAIRCPACDGTGERSETEDDLRAQLTASQQRVSDLEAALEPFVGVYNLWQDNWSDFDTLYIHASDNADGLSITTVLTTDDAWNTCLRGKHFAEASRVLADTADSEDE